MCVYNCIYNYIYRLIMTGTKNAQDTSPILLEVFLVAPNSHEVWLPMDQKPHGWCRFRPNSSAAFFKKSIVASHCGGTGNLTSDDLRCIIWGIPGYREPCGFASFTEWIGLVGKHVWDTMSFIAKYRRIL